MDFSQFKKNYQKKNVVTINHQVPSKPEVSVLVQTYQQKDFIRECLDGILKQKTNFTFEILVGEDASSDGTRAICLEYVKTYGDKIRLFLHHEENKIRVLDTTTGNFNALYNFFSANGKYLAFCEGDDFWTDPLKLQKQVDFLKANEKFILTYHPFKEVDFKKKALLEKDCLDQPKHNISGEDLKRLIYHPLLSTVCCRNPIKEEIPDGMEKIINVDSFFLSFLGNFGEAGFLSDIVPTIYRRHRGGIWSGQRKELKLKSKILTFKTIANYYNQNDNKTLRSYFQKKYIKANRALIYNQINNWSFKIFGN